VQQQHDASSMLVELAVTLTVDWCAGVVRCVCMSLWCDVMRAVLCLHIERSLPWQQCEPEASPVSCVSAPYGMHGSSPAAVKAGACAVAASLHLATPAMLVEMHAALVWPLPPTGEGRQG
jgi:hypothetical protein